MTVFGSSSLVAGFHHSSVSEEKNQADYAESQQMNLVGDGDNGALGKHTMFKSTFENK